MIETMQVDNLDFIGNPRSSLLPVRSTLLPKRSRVNVLRATCQRFLDDLAIRLIRRDLRSGFRRLVVAAPAIYITVEHKLPDC